MVTFFPKGALTSTSRTLYRLRKLTSAALGSLVAVIGLTTAGTVHAFCRTTTDAPSGGGCATTGLPVFWKNSCMGFRVSSAGSTRISADEANRIASVAFGHWSESPCADGNKPSVQVVSLGLTVATEIGVTSTGTNQNIIVFKDAAWPYGDQNQVALTTVTYRKDTGEILDADMEINTTLDIVGGDTIPKNGFDFESVVTHEAGHFLGLGHTTVAAATMFPKYVPGSTSLRSLDADDISGICSIYLTGGTRSTAAGTVAEGACAPNSSPSFSAGTTTTGCCAVAPNGSDVGRARTMPWGVLASAACLALVWKRRRTNATLYNR